MESMRESKGALEPWPSGARVSRAVRMWRAGHWAKAPRGKGGKKGEVMIVKRKKRGFMAKEVNK